MLEGIKNFIFGKDHRDNNQIHGQNERLGNLEIFGRPDCKIKVLNLEKGEIEEFSSKIIYKDASPIKVTRDIRDIYNKVVKVLKDGVAEADVKTYRNSSKEVVRYMDDLYKSKSLPTRIFMRLTGFKQLREDFANLKFDARNQGPNQIEIPDAEVVKNHSDNIIEMNNYPDQIEIDDDEEITQNQSEEIILIPRESDNIIQEEEKVEEESVSTSIDLDNESDLEIVDEEVSMSIDLDDDDDDAAPELSIAIPAGDESAKEQIDIVKKERIAKINNTDDHNKIVYPDTNIDLNANYAEENVEKYGDGLNFETKVKNEVEAAAPKNRFFRRNRIKKDNDNNRVSDNNSEPPQIKKRGNVNISADDSSKHDRERDFPKPY